MISSRDQSSGLYEFNDDYGAKIMATPSFPAFATTAGNEVEMDTPSYNTPSFGRDNQHRANIAFVTGSTESNFADVSANTEDGLISLATPGNATGTLIFGGGAMMCGEGFSARHDWANTTGSPNLIDLNTPTSNFGSSGNSFDNATPQSANGFLSKGTFDGDNLISMDTPSVENVQNTQPLPSTEDGYWIAGNEKSTPQTQFTLPDTLGHHHNSSNPSLSSPFQSFDGQNDEDEEMDATYDNPLPRNHQQSTLRLATPPLANPFTEPPVFFPTPFLTPAPYPPRLAPQPPILAKLDEVYDSKPHPILNDVKNGIIDDENRTTEAWETLRQHVQDRTPYVHLASQRLQAVLGLRNDLSFELPDNDEVLRRHEALSPNLHRLYDAPMMSREMSSSGSLVPGVSKRSRETATAKGLRINSISAQHNKRDSGISFGKLNGLKSPIGFAGYVDKENGRGLREFLLQKGKECGMRKRECSGISFHDFTPDMKTNSYSNILLGHFAAEKGMRVDVYEVDLPATQKDPSTNQEFPTTEPWIWFLLSRPFLTLPTSSSTLPPPSFPTPIPTSWVVFALPLANCISFPTVVETFDSLTSYGDSSAHATPLSTASSTASFKTAWSSPFGRNRGSNRGGGNDNLIHKRTDYDLSICGVPIFEFSPKPQELTTPFRSFCTNPSPPSSFLPLLSSPEEKEQFITAGEKGEFLSVQGVEVNDGETEEKWWGARWGGGN
ncbi:hypothetical protein G7Y89_g3350 [Cudoniella acicularis]|uniref:Uncharacterized protein n=1 Tax=Cudoniella acicularis TaxID=354080 RepID=A0A8H4W620_9HELO|nr:hypothetical protein G7Y89_g3350 [Cudoniella acicularis]